MGQAILPEIAPITGPMYQLFLFFMITDPRTVVKGKQRQIIVDHEDALSVDVCETFLAVGVLRLHVAHAGLPFYRLLTVG